jgi:hypothetical protein
MTHPTKIYSIELSTHYFIEPFIIQTVYESILKEYNNPIRNKSITLRGDWLIYCTILDTIPDEKLTHYKYQDGIYINFYKF